jgi:hypothetical protein
MFYKATNFLRSQSFYRKYGPNLPISLTHRVSIRPKAANLGDLLRFPVRSYLMAVGKIGFSCLPWRSAQYQKALSLHPSCIHFS